MRKGAHWQPKDPKDCMIDDLQEIVERRTGSKLERPDALNRNDLQRVIWALETPESKAAFESWQRKHDRYEFRPPEGEQLIETYRGYHITKRIGQNRCSIWTSSGAPAGSWIEGHEAARRVIDGYVEVKARMDETDMSIAPKGNRYSVEEQQDGTHAIFNNGGFVKGGYRDRTDALSDARDMASADEECGVPVLATAE